MTEKLGVLQSKDDKDYYLMGEKIMSRPNRYPYSQDLMGN